MTRACWASQSQLQAHNLNSKKTELEEALKMRLIF